MTSTTSPSTQPSWQLLADANGGIWNEHPDYPVADWKYAVDNDDTRAGYWQWVEGEIAAHADDAFVAEPQTVHSLPHLFRAQRQFEVVVFEVVKFKVTGLTATSYVEAAQQAEQIVGANRALVAQTRPIPGIDHIESAEEAAYFLADLMDGTDILESRWFNGSHVLPGDALTLEAAATLPFVELPRPQRPAPPTLEPNWDAPASGTSVLKGHG